MNFVVKSSDLQNHLLSISRVINNKNTLPILDNFLVELAGEELKITASDLESTLITTVYAESASGEGKIALPAKILTETLKEFPEQPLTFEIDEETLGVKIISDKGEFSIVGKNADEYPQLPEPNEKVLNKVELESNALLVGINKALFATADDELRPVMNGIFVELAPDGVTFVASDAHKLVRYKRLDVSAEQEASFILPKKPAGLLKNILPKQVEPVILEFDDKNAFITLSEYKLVCRLIEGNYPKYASVIPKDNPYKLTIDRQELYNTLRRVSVFSDSGTKLIRMKLSENELTVSAQDLDYSISAHETISCQYEGAEMEIGFKSAFLLEILSNLPADEVVVELSDPSRAGLFLPQEEKTADEDTLMLLMPMMLNA